MTIVDGNKAFSCKETIQIEEAKRCENTRKLSRTTTSQNFQTPLWANGFCELYNYWEISNNSIHYEHENFAFISTFSLNAVDNGLLRCYDYLGQEGKKKIGKKIGDDG